jgi:protein O-mannosyl-transferase
MPAKSLTLRLLALLLLTTLIYLNHFNNSFHFDDYHTIANNVYIRNIKNIPLFFKDGSTMSTLPQNQAYRPVVTTSLAVDYWLGNGYNMFWFHLSTFIFFLLQGVLMFLLLNKLLQRYAPF